MDDIEGKVDAFRVSYKDTTGRAQRKVFKTREEAEEWLERESPTDWSLHMLVSVLLDSSWEVA